MADLPETLTITVTIPPSNISAGSTVQAISTIGMGVPGPKGAQGDPGPKGDKGDPGTGTGEVNYEAGTPTAGRIIVAGSTPNKIADSGKTLADLATAAQGAKADSAVQPAGLTKAAVGLGNVDNTSDANKPVSTAQQTALDLKANLASAALTGTPTAPTATAGTNTTQVATTAFVQGALPVKAAGADLRTGTDDAKYLTSKAVRDAMAFVALTDAATIAVDMGAGINFSVTLGGNRTLGAPTNSIAGQSGLILVTQDGTGSRTLSYNSAWKFAGGTPTASTAAGTVDAIAYTVTTGGGSPVIRATYIKAFA